MRIIARRTLNEYVTTLVGQKDQSAVKRALDAWFDEVRMAVWKTAADVRQSFATVSIIGADRLVFNIKGNSYRLVVAVDYARSIIWIKWIGSHADYDTIDVRTVEYGG